MMSATRRPLSAPRASTCARLWRAVVSRNQPMNAPPVQRKTWQQIEQREAGIDPCKRPGKSLEYPIRPSCQVDDPEAPSEQETGNRAGHGDVELLDGAGRIAADTRHPAENKERDRNHGNFVVLGNDAVRHLMKHERAEEEDAGHQSQAPQPRFRNTEVEGFVLGNERESDQAKNEEPTRMKEDRYPVDPANLDSLAAHRGPVPQIQYSARRPSSPFGSVR